MNREPVHEHAWFRRRLPDHLLDLLVDPDRSRFDAHARSCASCARLLASATGARADWWDGTGHPPVGVLLAWDAVARGDRTHEAVRAHLARCPSCRHDLEDLHGPAAVSGIALAPVPGRRPRVMRPFPIAWAPALSAAAGLLVVVAAFVLLNAPAERAVSPAPHVTAPPAAATPSPPSSAPEAAPPAREVFAEPVEIAAVERGAEAGATRIDLAPGVTRIPLTLPALLVPEGASLSLELRGPGGAVAWRQVLPGDRALRRGGVVLPAASLVTGAHVLRVAWTDPTVGNSTREFALDVRTSR